MERAQWLQLAWITLGAVAIFAGLRLLPTGTNLSHMDFRVDPKAGNAIEFCDPANPQFIPVVAARSPVTMTIRPLAGVRSHDGGVAANTSEWILTLKTSSGKPVAPEDLLVTHTRRLHLLVVDATLSDYQHLHPRPTRTPGEWAFAFAPQKSGVYRIFGDFTPAATGRGLYASVDLDVAGTVTRPERDVAEAAGSGPRPSPTVERDGFRFTLSSTQQPARAGQPIDLRFAIQREDGAAVPLEPVMGAFAHLVAFDETRSGFAHLHPAEADILKAPDPKKPALNFKLTIPRAGRYVVWAQVNLGGRETFVPFHFEVL